MKVLSLDTSNQPLSVAILDDNRLLATTTITTHKKHAEFLMPIIEDLMKKSKLKPQDLDRVVVAIGPGSYTGIRIATTVAKTLAMTLNIELVTVSSLLNLALNFKDSQLLINPIFDGRNENMFTGLYKFHNGQPENVIPDQHTDLSEWLNQLKATNEKIIILGEIDSFAQKMKEKLGQHIILADPLKSIPSASELGIYGLHQKPVKDVDSVVPRYLRLTKAEADWRKLHPKEDTSNYVEKL